MLFLSLHEPKVRNGVTLRMKKHQEKSPHRVLPRKTGTISKIQALASFGELLFCLEKTFEVSFHFSRLFTEGKWLLNGLKKEVMIKYFLDSSLKSEKQIDNLKSLSSLLLECCTLTFELYWVRFPFLSFIWHCFDALPRNALGGRRLYTCVPKPMILQYVSIFE